MVHDFCFIDSIVRDAAKWVTASIPYYIARVRGGTSTGYARSTGPDMEKCVEKVVSEKSLPESAGG
jgi:hypothetical protein